MKSNIIYLQIDESSIRIKKEDKIYWESVEKIIDKYHIIDKNAFLEVMNNLIKKYKLNHGMMGSNIKILVKSDYSLFEQEYLKKLFEDLDFNLVEVILEKSIFSFSKDESFIIVGEHILQLIDKENYLQIYLDYSEEIVALIIRRFIRDNKKRLIKLVGNDTSISRITNILKKIKKVNYYKYLDSESYIINNAN